MIISFSLPLLPAALITMELVWSFVQSFLKSRPGTTSTVFYVGFFMMIYPVDT